MTDLPTPKRFVLDSRLILYADEAVADFMRLLKPVQSVLISSKDVYLVFVDARYAYDATTKQQVYDWLVEQLEGEYGNTRIPKRLQNDVTE